ncbi:MAG: replicative DNA helicase [Chitinophagales bacterium]|nr:MAG: replicative DNA helicase [Chitinophagales bacterium]
MPENSDIAKKPLEVISTKKEKLDLASYTFGKMPPQARELEEAVLGAMLLESNAVATVIDILRPESFYVYAHQLIYQAILNLFHKSKPVDILTVTEELRHMGRLEEVGGAFYISELTNRLASAANVEHHARIVAQKHIQRELIRISGEVIRDAYEETTDVFELLDRAEQGLYSIAERNLRRNYEKMSTLLSRSLNQLDQLRNHQDMLTGVPSGFTELDRVTGGWQKSDLIIIAARPGMGKTSFVLSIARNAAVDYNKPVAIFSLEMSSVQLVNRLMSAEAELPAEKLRRGNLEPFEWEQLTHKADRLAEAPIFIDDTPAINIFELRAKCRRLKSHHKVELFIVDYLQLMSASPDSRAGNREQEISNISRALKSIAKELETPFIAISQLSRAVEVRGGTRRPQLSDLRESGAIEQDADLVLFIYRAEYYKLEVDENQNPTRGLGEIIIAKHRNGALKNVYVRFIDKYAKFTDAHIPALHTGASDVGSESGAVITRMSRMNEEPEEDNGEIF